MEIIPQIYWVFHDLLPVLFKESQTVEPLVTPVIKYRYEVRIALLLFFGGQCIGQYTADDKTLFIIDVQPLGKCLAKREVHQPGTHQYSNIMPA